jgi:exodeoxyribonuclease VII large subunit
MSHTSASSDRSILSVRELVGGLSRVVEEAYSDVWVEGELSNFSRAASGHCYFTLKDGDAQIRCVMWRHLTQYVFFTPEDGLQVRLHGDASVYERRGDLQLMVQSMRLAGKGALQEAFEELKRQLNSEGLFDAERKKPLPGFPETIGLVTSGQGAALHDMLSVIERRFPVAHVVLCPVPVQGMDAPPAIADAIARFNALPVDHKHRPDVLIVGRGGGSVEDLWAFNEEIVARAIAASELPLISAVGHETDVSIADLVADKRAATPSMAAEIAVPDRRDITLQVHALFDRLHEQTVSLVRTHRQRVESLANSRALHRPIHQLAQHRQALDHLIGRLTRAGAHVIERHKTRLGRLHDRLRGVDPEGPLRRGYALVDRAGRPVRRADPLHPNDAIVLHFQDGDRHARITNPPPVT